MDVRCEQCGTEYELDESRLKPGGVTVKCTSCGHMFKIRKRAPTNVGIPVPQHGAAPSAPVPRQPTGQTAIPRPQTNTGSGPAGDRNWIVRLQNGEQRTCRELATLQQWIIAGDVTRESMISRSGKTWKQLGDIPELAQFFDVADEARDERVRRESARVTGPHGPGAANRPKPATPDVKQTLLGFGGSPPGPPPGAPPRRPATQPPPPPKALAGPHAGSTMPNGLPKSAPANDGEVPTLPRATILPSARASGGATPAAAPGAPAQFGGPPGAPSKLATPPQGSPSKLATPPRGTTPSASPPAAPPPRPVGPSKPPAMPSLPTDAAARSTGAWATKDVKQFAEEQSAAAGPSGPAGGQARLTSSQLGMAEPAFGGLGTLKSVPTDDVAFASSLNKRGGLDTFSAPEHLDDETTGPVLARGAGGGLGKWIAVGSLVVIAGAAIAIYALVIRGGDSDTRAAAGPLDAGLAVSDAAVVATTIDATVTPTPTGDDVLANAADGLRADTVTALEAAAAQLADGASAEDPARLALRARIATAIVQDLEDEATFTSDAKAATKLRADAKKRLVDAAALAQKAVKKAAGTDAETLAHVAMADVLRLQGKGARDVKKSLDRATALAKDDREAKLVTALLAAREGKTSDAKTALQELDRGDGALEKSGDVRARFRLAALAFTANDKDAAKTAAEQVVAVQPDHAGARALLARLRDAVATTDPMPPEDDPTPPKDSGGGSSTPRPTGGEPKGDDYDALLAKADQLAEVNCSQALPYYQKALAVKANGVAALTGIGYCYVDAKQFSSAHSSFRAALAVSRRYEPALWGVAEAYQQQGLKEKAIDAYTAYLEAYPGTQKAIKQIERLGGSVDGGGSKPPEEPKPVEEPKPEEPKPEPTPTPAPEGGGEGGATNPS